MYVLVVLYQWQLALSPRSIAVGPPSDCSKVLGLRDQNISKIDG